MRMWNAVVNEQITVIRRCEKVVMYNNDDMYRAEQWVGAD